MLEYEEKAAGGAVNGFSYFGERRGTAEDVHTVEAGDPCPRYKILQRFKFTCTRDKTINGSIVDNKEDLE